MLKMDKLNILYIEGSEEDSDPIIEFFNKEELTEFNITKKLTLKEALKHLEETDNSEIDVIILDSHLPNSQGIETYKSISRVSGNIPVVIISEFEDIACHCVRLGAQDYLIKSEMNSRHICRSLKYAIERNNLKLIYEKERDVSQMYLDVAGVMFLALDVNQNVTMINKKGCDILEYDESEIIGKNWFDNFIPEKIRGEIKEVYDKIISGDLESVEFYTNPILSKSGTEKYISWHNSLIKEKDHNIIIGVLCSGEDITDKILTEKRYQNLVEFTKAAIYEIDFIDNKFVYINHVFCEMLGYTKEELKKINPFEIIAPESLKIVKDRQERLKRGDFIENTFELEVYKKDGSTIWLLVTSEFNEDENGNVIGANVVAINITDDKKKEEMIFNTLEEKLQSWRSEIFEKHENGSTNLDRIDAKLSVIESDARGDF